MNGALDKDRSEEIATLRDHLYRHGPCSVAEAASATGLRVAQVSTMLAEGSLSHAGALPGTARCSICRAPADVGDLCGRCRQDLQGARAPESEPREQPAPDRGRGMRSRR